jgi:hypothetical protein
MSSAVSAKALAQARPPTPNVLPVPTYSFALTTMTSRCTRGRKYAMPWLFVKSNQKKTTLTTHESPLAATPSATLAVGTNTASLELLKLLLNNGLLQKGARFSSIDPKNFYLDMPMPKPEYVCIKILDILQEFIDEYKLTGLDCYRWIYFEICQGVCMCLDFQFRGFPPQAAALHMLSLVHLCISQGRKSEGSRESVA